MSTADRSWELVRIDLLGRLVAVGADAVARVQGVVERLLGARGTPGCST